MTKLLALLIIISLTACGGQRIEEDDPRWDCRSMGNGECGDEIDI